MMPTPTQVYEALRYRIEIGENGSRRYYDRTGRYHRDGGPAVEWANGDKFWYQNGQRHRTDGPAIEWRNGTKEWYQNGQRHHTDGPAIDYANGCKRWFINGKELTEAEFKEAVKHNV